MKYNLWTLQIIMKLKNLDRPYHHLFLKLTFLLKNSWMTSKKPILNKKKITKKLFKMLLAKLVTQRKKMLRKRKKLEKKIKFKLDQTLQWFIDMILLRVKCIGKMKLLRISYLNSKEVQMIIIKTKNNKNKRKLSIKLEKKLNNTKIKKKPLYSSKDF